MKLIDKKGSLHPDNPHSGKYNFAELVIDTPELKSFIKDNPSGDKTINFSDSKAVKCLNKALLKSYYGIEYWDFPDGYLCPPIPGRADYIHYANDLLNGTNNIKVLDIGTGANCIYPLIGVKTYNWSFTATDIDKTSIKSAQEIIKQNKLEDNVNLILQENRSYIFKGIIKKGEKYDLTICNPPFHSSLKEAKESNRRKVRNLNKGSLTEVKKTLNFGGQKAELWCPGGEMFFISKMIKESKEYKDQVNWFTSLVSKQDNIWPLKKEIKRTGARSIKVIEMSQGNKISRIIAWSFYNIN